MPADNTKHYWEYLTVYSQFYVLGPLELEHAREVVKTLASNIEDDDKEDVFMCLQLASIIAATSRDTVLTDEILNMLINIAPTISKDELLTILLMMLRTAGAHQTQHSWFEWLENGLSNIVTRLAGPAHTNKLIPELIFFLDQIEMVFPVESWFHIRARSMVLAGI